MQNQHLFMEKMSLEGQVKTSANWFYWIAGFSIINSLVLWFQGSWSFVVGLGITQFIDYFGQSFSAEYGNNVFTILAFVVDLLIAGLFVLFGVLANKRYKASFIIGMILYGLDGLIFIFIKDYLSLAFHAYALYAIYRGFKAINRLTFVEQAIAAPMSQEYREAEEGHTEIGDGNS